MGVQEELQEEVAQELGSYGIDPYAEGLTDEQYTTAMAELANRRQVLLAGKEPEEQRRIHAMRNNMLWHLQNVSVPLLASLHGVDCGVHEFGTCRMHLQTLHACM